jgi:hypothetical protein
VGYAVRLTASGDARVNRCREKEERIQVKRNVLVCSLIAVAGGAVVAQISPGDGPKRPEQPAITYPSEWLDELTALAEQNPGPARLFSDTIQRLTRPPSFGAADSVRGDNRMHQEVSMRRPG